MRKCLLLLLLLLMALPTFAQTDSNEITMVPFNSLPLDIQGLRPEGWLAQENTDGVFVRARDPLDFTAMIIQAQDSDKESFINSVLTSFQVEESLALVETVESDFFTWDVYQFERTQGDQELLVDMGIAEDSEAGRVYYVLLQTNAIYYDDLHEQAFLPAITWLSPIQRYQDPAESFSVPIPVQWDVIETDDFAQLSNADDSIAIFVEAAESDEPIVATQEFLTRINPDFDQVFDEEAHNLTLIEDPARIGNLEAVYIIDWANGTGEEEFVLQSVTRVYDGIAYITVIAATLDSILENESQIALIDNGYIVRALEANAEATVEPEE